MIKQVLKKFKSNKLGYQVRLTVLVQYVSGASDRIMSTGTFDTVEDMKEYLLEMYENRHKIKSEISNISITVE